MAAIVAHRQMFRLSGLARVRDSQSTRTKHVVNEGDHHQLVTSASESISVDYIRPTLLPTASITRFWPSMLNSTSGQVLLYQTGLSTSRTITTVLRQSMNLRGSITKTPLQNITLSLQQDLFLVLQDFLAEVDNSMLALDVDVY